MKWGTTKQGTWLYWQKKDSDRMSWQRKLYGDSLSWLLEHDEPGVRYLAMRELVALDQDDAE